MKYAFISYSVEDKEWGGRIKSCLENIGVKSFLAHEDLQVSEEWRESIIEALGKVDIFITVLSKNFKSSDWCSQEIGYIASRPDVTIIPLSIDGTTPYGFISKLQGKHVKRISQLDDIIEEVFFRKHPREMIPAQIQRVKKATNFRGAESVVAPLNPHYDKFTDEEIDDFIEAVVGNGQVWDASMCRSTYLPGFAETTGHRISDAQKTKLLEKMDHLEFPE